MRQVVTVSSTGSVEGLQVKPGKGFDLRKMGEADIERASEIVWRREQQAWNVKVLDLRACAALDPRFNPACGVTLTLRRYRAATGRDKPAAPHLVCEIAEPLESDWLYFDNYDDAVLVEIEVLDALRLRGLLN